MTSWRNWGGNVVASPVQVRHATSADGVADAVRAAARAGLGVRVAGSGHSFTPLVATDGMLLRVDGLSGVIGEIGRAHV